MQVALAVVLQHANGAAPRLLLQPLQLKGCGNNGGIESLLAIELLPAAPELPLRPPADSDSVALTLSGCCLVNDGERTGAARSATLAVLWGDGLLQLWDVPAGRTLLHGAGGERVQQAATPRSSRWLGGVLLGAGSEGGSAVRRTDQLPPPPPCALLALQSPQMLLFTPTSQPGSMTHGAECLSCLQLWETRYGTLLSPSRHVAQETPAFVSLRPCVRRPPFHALLQVPRQRTPDLAQRLASRSGSLSVAATRPLGVARCGGGGASVALAFEGAVLVCFVRTPNTSVGLAHSLGTAQRTCTALETSSALRPPLRHAPHVSDLLQAVRRPRLHTAQKPVPLGGTVIDAWRARAKHGDAHEVSWRVVKRAHNLSGLVRSRSLQPSPV